MADIDKLAPVRKDLLHRFHTAVEHNLQDLEGAMKTGRVSTVAWLTRNLLELSIWASHCTRSEENSKQFVLDAVRDVHDALNVPDGIFATDFSFREARIEAIEKTKADGFETLEESYTVVSKIARELGKGDEFRYLNKLLSKYAHPTALSVVYENDKIIDRLKEKFYLIGMNLARLTLDMIESNLK